MKLRVIFFTVYVFLGSLLPSSDFHELSKITYLLQHYQSHQEQSASTLPFLDFLQMHYKGVESKPSKKHDGLPLKQLGNSAYDYFLAVPLVQCPPVLHPVMTPHQFIPLDQEVPEFFSGSIWQPPQHA